MHYTPREKNTPIRLLTLDVDWAPDCMVEYVAQLLVEAGVKATWMVTHRSAAIENLRCYPDLFELGVHPNFSADSTQGKSVEAVIEYCQEIVPDAESVRTHSLFQSTPIYKAFLEMTAWKYDVSTFMPSTANLAPAQFQLGHAGIWKVPFYWEDDVYFSAPQPCWNLRHKGWDLPGLQIYNFHPVHIFYNTHSPEEYFQNKKNEAPKPAVAGNDGIRHIFCKLIRELQAKSLMIRDLFSGQRQT